MSELSNAIEEYVALCRRLGSKLRGVDSALRHFAAFAEQEGAGHVTVEVALRWAQQTTSARWWEKTVRSHQDRITREMERVVDDVRRKLE